MSGARNRLWTSAPCHFCRTSRGGRIDRPMCYLEGVVEAQSDYGLVPVGGDAS